jgi:hypothetical protein
MKMSKHCKSKAPANPVILLVFLAFLLVGLCRVGMTAELVGTANVAQASDVGHIDNCAMAVKLLKKQNHKLSRELGQIKREIGELRVAVHGVTPSKIFGGIGYILGLFGVAAMVAARKKEKG